MVFHYFIRVPRTTSHDPYGKIPRPAGPVPIYYEIYAIHPAQWRGFITVRYLGGKLLYSNKPDFIRGMIATNQLIYVSIAPNSEAPYFRS